MAIKLNNNTELFVDRIAGATDSDNGTIDFTNDTSISCRYGFNIYAGEGIKLESYGNNVECTISNGKLLYNDKEVATQEWVHDTALSGYATQQWVLDQGYGSGTDIGDTLYIDRIVSKTDSDIGDINFSYDGIAIQGRYGVKILDGEQPIQIISNNTDIILTTPDGKAFLYNGKEVATQDWVNNKNYITSSALNGYATETWVNDQNFLTLTSGVLEHEESFEIIAGWNGSSQTDATLTLKALRGITLDSGWEDLIITTTGSAKINGELIATQDWVNNKNYITSSVNNLSNYYTKTQIDNKNYLSILNNVWAHSSNLTIRAGWANETEQDATLTLRAYRGIVLDGGAEDVQIECDGNLTLNGEAVATQDWVRNTALSGYATQTWVNNQKFITSSANNLTNYYTKTQIDGKDYVTTSAISSFVTADEVDGIINQKGYITSSALNGYATQTWVTQKGYWVYDSSMLHVDALEGYSDSDQGGIFFSSTGMSLSTRYNMNISSGESSCNLNLSSYGNINIHADNDGEADKGNVYLQCSNAYVNNELIATRTWINNKSVDYESQPIYFFCYQEVTDTSINSIFLLSSYYSK